MRINFKKNGEGWVPDEAKFMECMFMTVPPNYTPLSTEKEAKISIISFIFFIDCFFLYKENRVL